MAKKYTKKPSLSPAEGPKKKKATQSASKREVSLSSSEKLLLNDFRAEIVEEVRTSVLGELKSEIVDIVSRALLEASEKTAAKGVAPENLDAGASSVEKSSPAVSAVIQEGGNTSRSKANFVNSAPDWLVAIEKEQESRQGELRDQYFRVSDICKKHSARLMALAEVTGVHVGFRRINDMIVSPLEYCIRVSVRKKRGLNDARVANPIESTIEGVRVDISERTFETIADAERIPSTALATGTSTGLPFDNEIFDRLRGGIVIANENSPLNWGTLGIILDLNGSTVALSCKHVTAGVSSTIIQPTRLGPVSSARSIGRVTDAVRNGLVDASIISLDPSVKTEFAAIVGENRGLLDASLRVGSAIQNARAFKVGAASDPGRLVWGRIQDVDATIDIDGFGQMSNQIIVQDISNSDPTMPLIQGGDSGSILLMQTRSPDIFSIVGLVHASTKDKGYIVASHWSNVLRMFPNLTI